MRAALARLFYATGEGNRLTPGGGVDLVLKAAAVALSIYIGWYAFYGVTNEHLHGAVFLLVMLPVIFLTTTVSRAVHRITPLDYALAAASVAVCVYYIANDSFYRTLIEGVTPIPEHEIFVGIVTVLLSIEACRRSVGWGLTSVLLILLAYVFFGHFLSGELHHDPIRIDYFVQLQTVLSVDGIFGTPLEVAATYAFLFVLFGSFYQRAGGGVFFFELATALCGRAVGGPAKACVVSSALYGSISGSPTADVVTTGPITIPLMTRTGISAKRAAAIEAAASSGGALLPPVMGTVAFLMVGFTGLAYEAIVKAGALVAILYYFGVFMAVHAEAKRSGQGQIEESQLVGLVAALRRGWRQMLPIVALLYFLVEGYTPTYVAAGATLFVVILSWLNTEADFRIGPRAFVEACMETVTRMSALTGAVLAAG
ncbi:MAG: TRAP transporter fused permease subunit, partial [Bauldia litoralis]